MYLFRFRINELPISPVYQLLFTVLTIVGAFIFAFILPKVIFARHSYTCTECGHHFKGKFFRCATIVFNDEKGCEMKCPHCKKLTYCKYDD